jgi:hypothetical protein
MPQVLRLFGYRVVIYFNDHRPGHVHVIGNGCEAVFDLNCPKGPSNLRENSRFTYRELVKIKYELSKNLLTICRRWKEIHGTYT